MNILWYLGAFVLALGLLIVAHELGHFLVARLCGVKVLRFSVGFGKPLVTRRFGRDGTEWMLAAFPLGGYVKMLDEQEGPVAPEEVHRAFNRQPVGRRAAVVIAGPVANLLLAVLIYWGLFIHGVEELRPILAQPPAGSAAARAAIQEGETVRSVEGNPIRSLPELRWEVLRLAVDHQPVTLETVNPRGEIAFRRIDTSALDVSELEGDILRELGLALFRPKLRPVVGRVAAASPAETAGIRAGDEVVAIEGRPVAAWNEVVEAIRNSPGRPVTLDVLREGRQEALAVTPASVEEGGRSIGRIGVAVREDPAVHAGLTFQVRYGPADALGRAISQTWDTSAFTLRMIGRMLVGDLSARNISGPITIADYAGQSARLGLSHYLKFLAIISISLGVLNLLPIPILDGGHLLYYFAEVVKGGPLSERVMEIGQQIGIGLLAFLMALAFYNDINRLVFG
ncbi:MAG: RIP metalloprotease RseP [Candidatus Nitricoxidivorans perseverans]|uniref:Zinc metalloprotease n=1 Tax=Candidatus Nitricoxidivorans perseverans TaxID=2975601 RepID=A0AA49IXP4_9PROT|nr:MAG: RIP metalloprotease RseP [Candidatus Nitricoxidivorans perseverans]